MAEPDFTRTVDISKYPFIHVCERPLHTCYYVRVFAPEHPLCDAGGWVPEHRILLFEAIGWGPHPCHWCGQEINWKYGGIDYKWAGMLVVDHVDGNAGNNDLSNIVQSCNLCNVLRGIAQRPPSRGPQYEYFTVRRPRRRLGDFR